MRAVLALVLGLAAATPAAAQITINVNSWAAPAHPMPQTLGPLCDDIAKVTSGRVKCNILPKAVANPTQSFDAVRDGIVDLSYIVHGYTTGRFVLTEAPELPLMGDTSEIICIAYQRIHERYLAKADEHKGVKVLAVVTHGPGQIYNTKREIKTLNDLKGLKMRVGGSVITEVATAVGAVPMLKPATEVYELMSAGVADGVFFAKDGVVPYNLQGIIKYTTFVPGGLYNISFGWLMNPAKWNSIPEADRKLIEPLFGEALARRSGKFFDAGDKTGEPALRANNVPIHVAGPEFINELKAKIAPLETAWIAKAKARGVDGEVVLKALREEIVKVAAEVKSTN